MASIVDKPKESHQGDLLEIEKFTNGLIKFIESSSTPITIGVQGEWGSGKTSLLNTIREDLCDKDGAQHYAIWLNTWEYSLLSDADETLIKIIIGLIDQIGLLTKKTSEESFKKVSAIGKSLLSRASRAGGVIGVAAGVASDVVSTATQTSSIRELRESLQMVVDKAIKNSEKKAFVFFIDDLDRLDPSVAVSILELIKNLFDLKNCIFVLAIDYGVVVKGLQTKFGKMTEENEWEFRAFFDKIIQLPFSMPISSFNISKYLQNLLVEVSYFEKNDLLDIDVIDNITETVRLSVGTNPRALKRLANSVSLIEIIRGNQKISTEEKVIEFGLVCIQIAYPTIYTLIQREPDFTNWDNQLVYSVLKNKKLDETDLETLKESVDFDEKWEQNLWRICQVSSFLRQRVHNISKLLNFIKDNIPNTKDEEISDTLSRLLSMSSVTSVSAESIVSKAKERYQRVDYENWDSYSYLLNERNIPEIITQKLSNYLNDLNNYFDNKINIVYAPSVITIKNPDAKGRQKVFCFINPQKKKIIINILKTNTFNPDEFPEGDYKTENFIGFVFFEDDEIEFTKYSNLLKSAYSSIS